MPLECVLRSAGDDRRAAVQDRPRADRSEPACPHGRGDHQRRRLRSGLVRDQRRRGPAAIAASRRRGATSTCATSPPTSSRRCSSRTSARRPARRCSRPTATRSVTGRWLFVHNGVINGFQAMRRELLLAVDPTLFDDIVGSTDSEALFYLALTFGLEDDPLGAMERAVGFVEATGRAARHRAPDPDDRRHEQRRATVGHPLLQPSTSRARCSSPSTPTPCASSIRTTRACSSSPTRIASSSPSRPATSPARGSRSPSRPR